MMRHTGIRVVAPVLISDWSHWAHRWSRSTLSETRGRCVVSPAVPSQYSTVVIQLCTSYYRQVTHIRFCFEKLNNCAFGSHATPVQMQFGSLPKWEQTFKNSRVPICSISFSHCSLSLPTLSARNEPIWPNQLNRIFRCLCIKDSQSKHRAFLTSVNIVFDCSSLIVINTKVFQSSPEMNVIATCSPRTTRSPSGVT